VGGNPRRRAEDLDSYRRLWGGLMSIQGVVVKSSVESVNAINVYEQFAMVSITMMQKVDMNGENLMQIKSIQNLFMQKKEDSWKICEANVANIYKEQITGFCPCKYMKVSGSNTKYTAYVLVPDGNSFRDAKIDFEFAGDPNDTRLIRTNENTYSWDQKGHITCVRKGGETVSESLSSSPAATIFDAMQAVLVNHIFDKNCLGLRTMPQK
jgi:hypothetical protein